MNHYISNAEKEADTVSAILDRSAFIAVTPRNRRRPHIDFYIAICFPTFRNEFKARTTQERIMQQIHVRPGLMDEIARHIEPVDERGNEIPVSRGDETCPGVHIKDIVQVLLMRHIDAVVDLLIESRKRWIPGSDAKTEDTRGCTVRWVFGRPPFLATKWYDVYHIRRCETSRGSNYRPLTPMRQSTSSRPRELEPPLVELETASFDGAATVRAAGRSPRPHAERKRAQAATFPRAAHIIACSRARDSAKEGKARWPIKVQCAAR